MAGLPPLMIPLSVIVTVVDGGAALERCLDALADEAESAELEIVVPFDSTIAEVPELARRFPRANFTALGELETARPAHTSSAWHERIDRRRAAGLAASRGAIVALVEDRGVPRPGWARGVLADHSRLSHAVIGGAVDFAGGSRLDWAAFLADFGRYRPPFAPGLRDYLSDVNVSYKRRAIESTRELWTRRYHETTVHWALTRSGEALYLSDRFAVEQWRSASPVGSIFAERWSSGRLFAATRAREVALRKRLALAALTPTLPGLMLSRDLWRRRRLSKARRPPAGTAAAFALLASVWSAGELVGYLTADG